MPERTILADVHNYLVMDDFGSRYVTATARRGDVVELSEEEIARAEALDHSHPLPHGPRLGSDEQLAQVEAVAISPSPASDEHIAGMTIEELAAYLAQQPQEAQHVVDLESGRPRPRRMVLELAQRYLEHEPEVE